MMATTSVRVLFEIGHEASIRNKKTSQGFTHDWELFVRGADNTDINYFVDRVIFNLHESFHNPRRVVKAPPFVVKESGYAGFNLMIDVYLRNKEEPHKLRFKYQLTLQETGPPISLVRKEKYVFTNPSEDFRRKLIKGGGVGVGGNMDAVSSARSSNSNQTTASATSTEDKNKTKPSSAQESLANKKVKPKESGSKPEEELNSNDPFSIFGQPIKTSKTQPPYQKSSSSSKDKTAIVSTLDKQINQPKSSKHTSNKQEKKDSDKDKEPHNVSSNKEREKDRSDKIQKNKKSSSFENINSSNNNTSKEKINQEEKSKNKSGRDGSVNKKDGNNATTDEKIFNKHNNNNNNGNNNKDNNESSLETCVEKEVPATSKTEKKEGHREKKHKEKREKSKNKHKTIIDGKRDSSKESNNSVLSITEKSDEKITENDTDADKQSSFSGNKDDVKNQLAKAAYGEEKKQDAKDKDVVKTAYDDVNLINSNNNNNNDQLYNNLNNKNNTDNEITYIQDNDASSTAVASTLNYMPVNGELNSATIAVEKDSSSKHRHKRKHKDKKSKRYKEDKKNKIRDQSITKEKLSSSSPELLNKYHHSTSTVPIATTTTTKQESPKKSSSGSSGALKQLYDHLLPDSEMSSYEDEENATAATNVIGANNDIKEEIVIDDDDDNEDDHVKSPSIPDPPQSTISSTLASVPSAITTTADTIDLPPPATINPITATTVNNPDENKKRSRYSESRDRDPKRHKRKDKNKSSHESVQSTPLLNGTSAAIASTIPGPSSCDNVTVDTPTFKHNTNEVTVSINNNNNSNYSNNNNNNNSNSPFRHANQHDETNDTENQQQQPMSSSRQSTPICNGTSPKFTDEYVLKLRQLQRKIMSINNNEALQMVVQIISDTGQYEVTAKTFDFDLCMLDESTVDRLIFELE